MSRPDPRPRRWLFPARAIGCDAHLGSRVATSRAAHREATRDCDEPNCARVAANDTLVRLLEGGIPDSGRGVVNSCTRWRQARCK
jgi:hypothetical protein